MSLTALEAAALVAQLAQLPGPEDSKAALIAIAQAAGGLDPTSFKPGDPSERFLEYTARALASWGRVPTQAVVSFFFPLATDPGDVNDFGVADLADQADDMAGVERRPPRPGFLSSLGAGFFFTIRGERDRATSFVTITNTGASATSPFAPGDLTFEASLVTRDDSGTPTYVTTADTSIYTGIGGTLALAAGASVTLPVQCVQLGTYGSVSANDIDTCVTQSFGTIVVNSSTTAVGSDREPRADYIARCLTAGDSLAPGGPGNAYRRAMSTGRDGKRLQRYDGSGGVTILSSASYVSPESGDNEVIVYYCGPSGAVDAVDVSSANANICGTALGVITDPMGVLPDTVVIGPATSDPGTGGAGGESCTNDLVKIHWTAKIKASAVSGGASAGTYGTPREPSKPYAVGQRYQEGTKLYVVTGAGTSSSGAGPTGTGTGIADGSATVDYVSAAVANTTKTLAIFTKVKASLSAYLLSTGVGGDDQVSGAGSVYVNSIRDHVTDEQPGLYAPDITLPAGTVSVALGHITTASTVTGVLTVTA
jgi:hypothetical protein